MSDTTIPQGTLASSKIPSTIHASILPPMPEIVVPRYSPFVSKVDITGLITATANHSHLLDAYAFVRRKVTKSHVAILLYHRVCPKKDDWSLEPSSPDAFQKQLEHLCRGYEIVSLEKLVQYIQQGKSLPRKAVVITFDDGYKDNYLYAYPILKKYHIPATIFLTTGHIGTGNLFWWDKVAYLILHANTSQISLGELGTYSLQAKSNRYHTSYIICERLKKLPEERKNSLIENLLSDTNLVIPPDLGRELILSWSEIREMSSDGISFGAHSVNHPILTNMPLEQAILEIIQSRNDIEGRLGQAITIFSYPDGAFSPELVKFVKESGFTCAVTTASKLISPKADPYELSRIRASLDFNKFKTVLCGVYGDLKGTISRESV